MNDLLFDLMVGLARIGSLMLDWAWSMNGMIGVLALAAVAADVLLARRVGAAWRIAFYLPLLVRLALPLDWTTPVGVAPVTPHGGAPWRVILGPSPVRVSREPVGAASPHALPLQSVEMLQPGARFIAVPIVYALVVLGLLVRWRAGANSIARIVKDSIAVEPAGCRGLDVRAHPSAGPLLTGLWRPVLIVPELLLSPENATSLDRVIRHESAHLSRGDHLLAPALHALTIGAWPALGVWVAASRVRALMEQACDERVLRGRPAAERTAYAGTLLDLSALRRPRSGGTLAFGAGARSRLRAMRFSRRWPALTQGALVLPIACAMLACSSSRSQHAGQTADLAPSMPHRSPIGQNSAGAPGVLVTIHLLKEWPKHPKLEWDIQQRPEGDPTPIPPEMPAVDRLLSREELEAVLAAAGPGALLSAPRLAVAPGQEATVRIGNDDRDGNPLDGFSFTVTPTLADESIDMRMDFDEFAPQPNGRSLRDAKFNLPRGKTMPVLSLSMIGGERRLILISAHINQSRATGNEFLDSLEYPVITTMARLGTVEGFLGWDGLIRGTESNPVMRLNAVKGGKKSVFFEHEGKPTRPSAPGWARVMPESRVMELYALLESRAKYTHTASPMLLTKPGEWGSISAAGEDKPHNTNLNEVSARSVTQAGATITSFKWADADGQVLGAGENIRIPDGYCLAVILPGLEKGEPGRVLVLSPDVVWEPQEYPVQRSSSLHGEVRVEQVFEPFQVPTVSP